jgi:hypothetical protein
MQATTDKPTLAWEEEDVREWAGKGDAADKSLAISHAMAAAEAHPDDRDRQKALAWARRERLDELLPADRSAHR